MTDNVDWTKMEISPENIIELNSEDFEKFMQVLDRPAKPNEHLKKLFDHPSPFVNE